MKKKLTGLLCIFLSVLLLTACGTDPLPSENVQTAESTGVSAGVAESPDAGSSESSDIEALTAPVDLKDDFYAAINAQWLADAEIPADSPVVGSATDLTKQLEEVLIADFDAMLTGAKAADTPELQNFIEYYRLAKDYETRNSAGAEPLLPYLEMVENLSGLEDFSSQWAQWDLQAMPSPFSAVVTANMGDAASYALHLAEPGLFLLEPSFYADEATKNMLQEAYAGMTVNLLTLAGKTPEEAEKITAEALAFDESLVPYSSSAERLSDLASRHNPVSLAELDEQLKAFDLQAAFTELAGSAPEEVILINPDYFAALDTLVNDETFPAFKSWLLVKTVTEFAPYLSNDFRVESGSFNRLIGGTAEAATPEKSAYYVASGLFFDEVVGMYYGKTYFGEEARADVAEMVDNMLEVYQTRLSGNAWLSDATKETALKKLDAMIVNVGYPDSVDPIYSQLIPVPVEEGGSLLSNAVAFNSLAKKDNYSQLGQPVDRGHWAFSASTVNAGYSPLDNSITFPAAILQAPYYSKDQSIEENYGGIGTVIAHEISHAFDTNGAKFDELGTLKNWWTEEDYAKFEELSQAMIDQFDGIGYAGGTVNGQLTVGENIADAGGLSCALEAAKQEGEADLQTFFTNWAVIWRQKASPEYESLVLTTDPHAPNKLRTNIQLQNMDDFFTAFDIEEGDGMYRAPKDRVSIW